jgi:hypothetical protein
MVRVSQPTRHGRRDRATFPYTMRVLGALLLLLGGAGTSYAVRAAFARRRPADVAWALAAPVALAAALTGALLLFVPDFFG